MNAETEPFDALLTLARTGDQAALWELARHYEPEIRTVARLRLGPALRPYLDSIDLVQSVHRSLMRGLQDDKFELSRPEQLVALALTMVRRKAAHAWRKLRRQERPNGLGKASRAAPCFLQDPELMRYESANQPAL